MRTPEATIGPIGLPLVCLVLAFAQSGCGGGGESRVATSGDPEADQRANLRVDAQDGRSKDARTLYDRLGGAEGIAAIIDDMTTRAIADPRVNFERRNIRTSWIGGGPKPWEPTPENVELLKRHLVEFLTLAAGGPAEYTGRDIRVVHKGMRVSNNEFDAMVGDIKTSMDRLGTATREKRDLLAIVETTRKQIVERQ